MRSLRGLSPEQQRAAASELISRRAARSRLLDFVRYTTPRWSDGPIHRVICDELDNVVSGQCDRLILLCPPQHGKSTITSKRLAAYILGRDPTQEVIGVSASAPLAEEFGAATRDCINSPEYRKLFQRTLLRQDSRAKGRWRTDQGGGYYAVGVGGDLYGRGGMAIIDDPFGSWEDAQSETNRKRVINWYTGTLYNRIHPSKPIIVIQHRMHENDLVGYLLNAEKSGGDKWRVVLLPARVDAPPWPERYGPAQLERIRMNMHPRQFAALYMQNPTPDDGTEFKAEWWRYVDMLPPADQLTIYMSGDFAVTEQQKSKDDPDYSVLKVFGIDHNRNVYVMDCWADRVESDKLIMQMVRMFKRWRPSRFIGESGPIRRAIEPFLKMAMKETSIFATIEWLPSVHDKVTATTAFQAMMSNGRVHWPHTDWAEATKSEMLKFPGGAHDDRVDACSLFGRFIGDVWAANPPPEPVKAPDWDAPLRMDDLFRRQRAGMR